MVGAAQARAVRTLADAGVPTPEVDAVWLLAHATGWTRARLRAEGRSALPPDTAARFAALVARRAERVPLQLLVGTVGFRHLELAVAPGVFIPRPETEVLAGEAIARVPPGGLVVEPCTGAGVVACAVASESPAARVLATDTDPAAVALAGRNAAPWADRLTVREGDLLDPVDPSWRGRVDVLVANPPYLADGELEGLGPEVIVHDPAPALVAGPSGHEVSDRLVAAAVTWLAPSGWLLMEVDQTRASETAARCRAAGLTDAAVVPDLTGAPRIVTARRPS